jgi:hypothetical protein
MKKRLPLLILALMGATLSQAQLFPKKTDSSQSSVKTSINKYTLMIIQIMKSGT